MWAEVGMKTKGVWAPKTGSMVAKNSTLAQHIGGTG